MTRLIPAAQLATATFGAGCFWCAPPPRSAGRSAGRLLAPAARPAPARLLPPLSCFTCLPRLQGRGARLPARAGRGADRCGLQPGTAPACCLPACMPRHEARPTPLPCAAAAAPVVGAGNMAAVTSLLCSSLRRSCPLLFSAGREEESDIYRGESFACLFCSRFSHRQCLMHRPTPARSPLHALPCPALRRAAPHAHRGALPALLATLAAGVQRGDGARRGGAGCLRAGRGERALRRLCCRLFLLPRGG